jgi:protein TonB
MLSWISQNIRYPVAAQRNGVHGRVLVSFVVEKNGSVSDVRVLRSADPSLDNEAVRVVRAMPRWSPGKQNGQPVRVKYTLPVTFKL